MRVVGYHPDNNLPGVINYEVSFLASKQAHLGHPLWRCEGRSFFVTKLLDAMAVTSVKRMKIDPKPGMYMSSTTPINQGNHLPIRY